MGVSKIQVQLRTLGKQGDCHEPARFLVPNYEPLLGLAGSRRYKAYCLHIMTSRVPGNTRGTYLDLRIFIPRVVPRMHLRKGKFRV